jgi:hypothetical protein
MTVQIGQWAMRSRYRIGHLVESIVAGDAITRCGRRLTDERTTGGDLEPAPFGTPKCRQCTSTREQETPS